MVFGLINIFALLAEGGGVSEYLPEIQTLAKTVNIILFVLLMVYILRKPLGEAFRTRRENIRRDLLRAQEERNAALAKLEDVDARLARLDAEVEAIRAQAQRDAVAERARIEQTTEEDIRKLREQAQREIESASKAARAELRKYAAEQSVRLAEEMIRRDIRPEDDVRLVREYVDELGGVGR